MDGMLSQDEINALLSGMDATAPAPDEGGGDAAAGGGAESSADQSLLTDAEKDAVGEVANISLGSSATTLSALLNQKVDITTPVVSIATWDEVAAGFESPFVFIQIKYTVGLDGTNILILKDKDVMVITDLMMGGDGSNTDGELGELQLSAISEAMNQMMGSAATALSTMIGQMVDISPPEATLMENMNAEPGQIADFLTGSFVKISFEMKIADLVDSFLMQLYPIDFAKSLYDTFITSSEGEAAPAADAAPAVEAAPAPAPAPDMGMSAAPMGGGMPMGGAPMGGGMMGMPMAPPPGQPMNIQPAQFASFGTDMSMIPGAENISLIRDVPLEVTVELGRATKPIADILDFAPGTIIELDKIAGEPVDVLVNGKHVARGEVVVIEESFGVRVTEIIQ